MSPVQRDLAFFRLQAFITIRQQQQEKSLESTLRLSGVITERQHKKGTYEWLP